MTRFRSGNWLRLRPYRPPPQRWCLVAHAIRARWQLQASFGRRPEAVELLQVWLEEVASLAEGTYSSAAITSGMLGVPTEEVALELDFQGLVEFQIFWESLPEGKQRAWSQRAQTVLVARDGMPKWTVSNLVTAAIGDTQTQEAATRAGKSGKLSNSSSKQHGLGPEAPKPTGRSREHQGLPDVPFPRTTGSGLTIVSNPDEVASVLSADSSLDRSILPSNRNSVGPNHPESSGEDVDAAHLQSGNVNDASRSSVEDGASGFSRRSEEGNVDGQGSPKSDPSEAARKFWGDKLNTSGGGAKRREEPAAGDGAGKGASVRVGGGIRIPAGGAPPGSRLGAMVGDSEYYERLAEEEAEQRRRKEGRNGNGNGSSGHA